MGNDRLSNRQFVLIGIIIIICGIAILGHDYFLSKRSLTYENMSILLSQEPEESVEDQNDPDSAIVDNNNENSNGNNGSNNNSNTGDDPSGDTSGRVKRVYTTYHYVGRLKIPKIRLNRGFVKYGSAGNNVNQNIAIMSGSTYPSYENSNLIIAAHNGSGWNAFFTNIDKLSLGDKAIVTYKGKQYNYKLVKRYKDPKSDGKATIKRLVGKKQLTLVTCKRPDYRRYYLVLIFELTSEKDIKAV